MTTSVVKRGLVRCFEKGHREKGSGDCDGDLTRRMVNPRI